MTQADIDELRDHWCVTCKYYRRGKCPILRALLDNPDNTQLSGKVGRVGHPPAMRCNYHATSGK